MKKIIGIIPSRYASTRFPGKPLADIGGKPMIQRVFEQASKSSSLAEVIVATDDERIQECVLGFGGKVAMTSPDHTNGTERCAEVAETNSADYYINIQGDEPFIHPEQIDTLAAILDGSTQLGTLVKKITDPSLLDNPNTMKVVLKKNWEALYFSRNCVPFVRDAEKKDWLYHHTFYKHIGIYAYRADVLSEITKLPQGLLEKAESLEQLRWLENGYTIKVAETEHESMGIDTPEDVDRALKMSGL
ncbi:MAG: 3-deoxy-manno-octulosonate cytidylyltransferase [Cyclobacteriaceae bacterium]